MKKNSIKEDQGAKKLYFYYLNEKNDENHEAALKFALDIRKFEIELYWKRATYFWAFIAAIFAGFFALKASNVKIDLFYFLLLGILGYIFSFSWHIVNRASKFWQQNWEMHVDMLEDESIGAMYKIVKNPDKLKLCNPLDSYACSVTKINQLISLFVSLTWIYIIYDSLKEIFLYSRCWILITAALFIAFLLSVVIVTFTKSSLKNCKRACDMFIFRK